MKRREFITLLGGAAAWPLVARAQQPGRMKRIGVLLPFADEPEGQSRVSVFEKALAALGWVAGRDVTLEKRWGSFDTGRIVAHAKELTSLNPDVILAGTTRVLLLLQKETASIPIIFVGVSDPLGQGLITSLAHPGGNVTGFSNLEFSLLPKWLQTLKEIAPNVIRVALMLQPDNATAANYLHSFESIAPSFSVEPLSASVNVPADIERAMSALAGQNAGLLLPGDAFTNAHGALIASLALRHRVPAIASVRSFVAAGGLISYGHDPSDPYRGAASYVDRVLRGEKPGDLPVQAPTKYELVINLKTAQGLGIGIPSTLLIRADEVIE
jgi:putative ABC transport system substrate-binding protein